MQTDWFIGDHFGGPRRALGRTFVCVSGQSFWTEWTLKSGTLSLSSSNVYQPSHFFVVILRPMFSTILPSCTSIHLLLTIVRVYKYLLTYLRLTLNVQKITGGKLINLDSKITFGERIWLNYNIWISKVEVPFSGILSAALGERYVEQ